MKKSLVLASFAVTAAGFCLANEEVSFASFDADTDGLLTIEEASANEALLESFTALDANADGMLSEEEFAQFTMAAK